jgi:(5-formylfuran-3-yl)methyl phosphate synthase
MQLLVSVQNREEARAAWSGGAAIIDAKDPGRGALGPVTRSVLREIRAAVPAALPVSAALGGLTAASELELALKDLPEGLAFVKLGFLGMDADRIAELLAKAVKLAARSPGTPRVVAVAYADWRGVGGPAPELLPPLIQRAGAHGLLVDTAVKDGRTLADHLPADDLIALGRALQELGLSYALGGSLTPRDIPLARVARAGIIGVRGAVTVGGRSDAIDPARVAAFAQAIRGSTQPSLR